MAQAELARTYCVDASTIFGSAETLVDLSSFTKNVLLALGVVCAMMAALIVAALSRHLN